VDGFIWMPDSGFDHAFAQNATREQIALCKAVEWPIAVKCIQEPVAAPAWKTKPSWFSGCRRRPDDIAKKRPRLSPFTPVTPAV
jgi:hypothetical protein